MSRLCQWSAYNVRSLPVHFFGVTSTNGCTIVKHPIYSIPKQCWYHANFASLRFLSLIFPDFFTCFVSLPNDKQKHHGRNTLSATFFKTISWQENAPELSRVLLINMTHFMRLLLRLGPKQNGVACKCFEVQNHQISGSELCDFSSECLQTTRVRQHQSLLFLGSLFSDQCCLALVVIKKKKKRWKLTYFSGDLSQLSSWPLQSGLIVEVDTKCSECQLAHLALLARTLGSLYDVITDLVHVGCDLMCSTTNRGCWAWQTRDLALTAPSSSLPRCLLLTWMGNTWCSAKWSKEWVLLKY